MTRTLRWGILGAAKFARQHMGPAIHAARNNRLTAIATSSPDKAAPFQEFAGDIAVYTSYDDLLNDPEIDAVYIPLPNHLHIEWSKRAALAGKHVLCEKPIALRADQIDELIYLRDQTGLMIAEAFMITHHPQWIYARELLDAGAIGALMQVDGVFSYNNAHDPTNIRNNPDYGGGSLPDIGVYTMGSTRFATGQDPKSILHSDLVMENGVDVWAHVTAQFDGFKFSSVTSMRMAARQEMTFHGDQGIIRLTAPFNPSVFDQAQVVLHRPDMEVVTKRFPSENHYIRQVENFRNTVFTGADYPTPLEFSQGTQRMMDMAFDAANSIG